MSVSWARTAVRADVGGDALKGHDRHCARALRELGLQQRERERAPKGQLLRAQAQTKSARRKQKAGWPERTRAHTQAASSFQGCVLSWPLFCGNEDGALLTCSTFITSMITPPLRDCAIPRFTAEVPVAPFT